MDNPFFRTVVNTNDQERPTIFDGSTAMSNIYMWMLFGLVVVHIDCDFRRVVLGNPVVSQSLLLLIIYFLFTAPDPANAPGLNPALVWAKTLAVYVLFVMSTKSRWYFTFATLALLLADQVVKHQYRYLLDSSGDGDGDRTTPDKKEELRRTMRIVSNTLKAAMVTTVLVGVTHYALDRMQRYGSDFSWKQFILKENRCTAMSSSK